LENPFLLSSSVVASTYERCTRAFEAVWAGAAFKTISTRDIHETSPRFSAITGANGSIIGGKNIEQLSNHNVTDNMAIFRQLKKSYLQKFILASIIEQNEPKWTELVHICQEKGIPYSDDIVGNGLVSISNTTDGLERDTILFPQIDRPKAQYPSKISF